MNDAMIETRTGALNKITIRVRARLNGRQTTPSRRRRPGRLIMIEGSRAEGGRQVVETASRIPLNRKAYRSANAMGTERFSDATAAASRLSRRARPTP
ncbi:hypothetical protein EVAR_55700_1 [Eumeta japonica]|uniref:Uncharacterized protein n=1 Tax=Eumeta variegata TaxID=151549 RepID=A0A4C1ZDI5_EUMVA|nr:hypothetical protein EVAR_55700_1 [Eumeta japonica]